jgi:molecular chaperone DnaK
MRRIIGIDLGTTNSAASFLDGNEPRIIPNDRGNRITPSIVAFSQDNDILVGEAAKNQAVINASRTVLTVKRFMGTGKKFFIGDKEYNPEVISSLILQKIKEDTEAFLGEEIKQAVITVPAYFKENQRRATQEAGRMAGLRVRRIINEPTAASIAYAYEISNNSNILVYDLGGGTFDVTYLKKRGNDFTVLTSKGDNNLGGIDFDTILLEKVVEEFSRESGINLREDKVILQQLMDQVERAKIELSSRDTALVALPFIGGNNKTVHLNYTLHRTEFEKLIHDKITRTAEMACEAVREAGDTPDDVENLILAGGSSRIPLVRQMLSHHFPVAPEKKINPEEVVALGAGIQASLLSGSVDDIVLKDITPFSLGVEIEGGKFITILERNSQIPAKKKRMFTTVSNNQRSVEIHVLQGESEQASDNTSLGRFLLSGIRAGKKGAPQIEVTFSVDVDGIVHVSARDRDTGVEQKVSVTSDYREELPKDSFKTVAELKNKVDALISRVEKSVLNNTDIDKRFRKEIDEVIETSREAVKKGELKELMECQVALETIVGELNAVRLDSEELQYG